MSETASAPPELEAAPPWRRWLPAILILLVSIGVYANTLTMEFTLDDKFLILDNPRIDDPSWAWDLFFGGKLWRPLKRLSLMIDYRIWGREHPGGFHATNVALHAAACLALFAVARGLRFSRAGATAVALLFSVHPVHVEAVANICHRKEPMALLFSLLAFLAYLRGREADPRPGPASAVLRRLGLGPGPGGARAEYAAWAALCYLLAMLSKDVASVMLPATVVVHALFLAKEPWRERVSRVAAFLPGFVVVLAIFTFHGYIGTLGRRFGAEQVGWASAGRATSYADILPVAVKAFGVNAGLLVWPWPLYFDRVFEIPKRLSDPGVLAGLSALALYVAGMAWTVRRAGRAFFALSWYGLNLLPVSNLIPLSYWFVAERFLYVPSVAFALLVGLGIETLWRGRLGFAFARGQRVAGGALLAGLLVLHGSLTVVQNEAWREPVSLWRNTLAHNPRSSIALFSYGLWLEGKGRVAEAEEHYRRAIAASPRNAHPFYALAILCLDQHRIPEAIDAAREVTRLEPDDSAAYMVIGNAEFERGRYQAAAQAYGRVVAIDPTHAEGLYNLANALYEADLPERAIEVLDRLVVLEEGEEARLLRGLVLEDLDRDEDAITSFRRAAEIAPSSPEPANALGRLLARLGRRNEAAIELERSLRLDPGQREPREILEGLSAIEAPGTPTSRDGQRRNARPARRASSAAAAHQ